MLQIAEVAEGSCLDNAGGSISNGYGLNTLDDEWNEFS